jgi:hypothetical protein
MGKPLNVYKIQQNVHTKNGVYIKRDVHTSKRIEQLFKTIGFDLWCLKIMLRMDFKKIDLDLLLYNSLPVGWYEGFLNPLINL